MVLESYKFTGEVCQMSKAFPSANPSLISSKTISLAISLCAKTSAHVAPTFPAPTTVTFHLFIIKLQLYPRN